MSRLLANQDKLDGTATTGDAPGSGELLPPRVWAGPCPSVLDAREAALARAVADKAGGGRLVARGARFAAFAALRSYRAVYGDEIRGGSAPIVDALTDFWLDQYRSGYPAPEWLDRAEDEETPAASENTSPSPSPSKAVEGNGR